VSSELEPRMTAFRRMMRDFYDTKPGNAAYNISGTVQLIACGVGGICLVYLVLGVFSGDMTKHGAEPGAVARYQWVSLALVYAIIVLALAYFIRNVGEDGVIIVLGCAGAICYIGLPILLQWALAQQQTAKEGANAAADAVRKQFLFVGLFLWGLSAIRALIFAIDRAVTGGTEADDVVSAPREIIARAANRPIRANTQTRPGPLARCWEQPHCIDFIKEVCQPWAAKRTCWKLQTGCMCDVRYLYEALKQDQTTGMRADHSPDARWMEEARELGGGGIERRLFCRDCRIYLEHQRRKFRFFSPLALPITALMLFAAHPLLSAGYNVVVGGIKAVIQTMWLSDDRDLIGRRFESDMSGLGIEWAVLIVFGLFLLSATMRFIEWLTLELKV